MVEDVLAPRIVDSHQVLVQVKAAGIDYLDIRVAQGYGRVLRQQLNKYNLVCKFTFFNITAYIVQNWIGKNSGVYLFVPSKSIYYPPKPTFVNAG